MAVSIDLSLLLAWYTSLPLRETRPGVLLDREEPSANFPFLSLTDFSSSFFQSLYAIWKARDSTMATVWAFSLLAHSTAWQSNLFASLSLEIHVKIRSWTPGSARQYEMSWCWIWSPSWSRGLTGWYLRYTDGQWTYIYIYKQRKSFAHQWKTYTIDRVWTEWG